LYVMEWCLHHKAPHKPFRSRMEKNANSKAFGVDYTHWATWEYHLWRSMCYVFNFKSTKNLQVCFIEGKWWHFKTRE
jgi:hypothetical protein